MANLVVPGGNGFIGQEICRIAVQNGHDVAAFGRSGHPALSPARHPWMGNVNWRSADVFHPEQWSDLMDEADAVIHCIATLWPTVTDELSYDRAVAAPAFLAAEEAVPSGADAFVFLSAQDNPPLIPNGFLSAKRRVERELPEKWPSLRIVSLRPNLVFGPGRRGSSTAAAILNWLPDGVAGGYAAADGRPLPVEIVAKAAVHAAITDTVEGTVSGPRTLHLAQTSPLVDPQEPSRPTLRPLLLGAGVAVLTTGLLSLWRERPC